MSTRLIEPRKRGANLNRLTVQQRMFVKEFLASDNFSPKEAARKAGFKKPAQAATKLLHNPVICAAIGKAIREREERCELKSDDVLNYLRTALFFNPLKYFRPSADGSWEITDLEALPEEVGRLIERMEYRVKTDTEGNTTSYFQVELVSKSTVLNLAMKHLGLLDEKLRISHSADKEMSQAVTALISGLSGTGVQIIDTRAIEVEAQRGLPGPVIEVSPDEV